MQTGESNGREWLHAPEGLLAYGFIREQLTSTTNGFFCDELDWTDNRKAERLLGWKPKTNVRCGFAHIFEWVRQNEGELRARYSR
jgi:nucleoside-diphosphate-sugar epimerase